MLLVLFLFFFFFQTLFHSSRGWSRWVPGIKKMPTEVAVSHPGAQPTPNTPKKEKRKHKINQQDKTKRTKKFRSFSSSLAGTHNSLCVTDVTVGKARAQKKASQPASFLQMAPALLLHSLQQEGHHCPHSLPSPVDWGCSFTTWKMGRRKERVSQAPKEEAGQGKVRKVIAQR